MQIKYPYPPEEPKRPTVQVIRRSICDDWGTEGFVDQHIIKGVSTIQEGLAYHGIELNPLCPTLIQAPTGFGKSYFILHHLLPLVKEAGGQMLLLSNRIAISAQQKREIAKVTGFPKSGYYTHIGIQELTDFGCIRVMTIQSLPSFLKSDEGKKWYQKVMVVVIDECHFFTADALFNPYCGLTLRKITTYFPNAVRLYLSATPEHVIGPIAKAEESAPPPISHQIFSLENSCIPRRQFQHLRFQVGSYDHIAIRYFKELETLKSHIATSPSNERWLIFVPSKKLGQELVQQLGEGARFISADDKEDKSWKTLVQSQKLPCRILISTSVLDCGVNIHDDSLKHVVILLDDKITFLQALGRKRCKKGETFNLYVQQADAQRVATLTRAAKEQLSIIRRLEEGEEEYKIISYLWNHGTDGERILLQPPCGRDLRQNQMAVYALRLRAESLAQLQASIEEHGDAGFPRTALQWLGQEDGYDERHWLEYDGRQEDLVQLENFLSSYLGCTLQSAEEQETFRSKLLSFELRLTEKTRHKNRTSSVGYRALNNALQNLKVPYILKVEHKYWILSRIEEGHISDDS